MLRREFSVGLLGTGLLGLSSHALAQIQLKPTDYTQLKPPVHTESKKIEVLEFFWYGCSHCFAFEPALEAWVKKLPTDVIFKRVPVAFNASFAIHQRLYYALEALDKVEALHGQVFKAMHVDKNRLEKDEEVIALMVKNGLDKQQFTDAFVSFSTSAKANQATRMAGSYKIEGVPSLAVQGRYVTSGSQAGSGERSLLVTNELIARARKGA
jgi:protein dithiol oxidoreductase (disulfide-forming)